MPRLIRNKEIKTAIVLFFLFLSIKKISREQHKARIIVAVTVIVIVLHTFKGPYQGNERKLPSTVMSLLSVHVHVITSNEHGGRVIVQRH